MALRHLVGLVLTAAVVCGALDSAPAAASQLTDKLDLTAPTASISALPPFAATTAVSVGYSGSDDDSGVKNYDVRYKVAAWRSAFGDYVSPDGWQGRTATSVRFAVTAGSDYCVSVRSRDNNDNVSPWTADSCTAVALDDRSLARKGTWRATTRSTAYRGTVVTSSTYRSSLSVAARGKQMALVVTTCPKCGTLAIVLDGQLWKTISTRSSRTARKVLLVQPSANFVVDTRITLGVASRRPVIVDGIAVTSH